MTNKQFFTIVAGAMILVLTLLYFFAPSSYEVLEQKEVPIIFQDVVVTTNGTGFARNTPKFTTISPAFKVVEVTSIRGVYHYVVPKEQKEFKDYISSGSCRQVKLFEIATLNNPNSLYLDEEKEALLEAIRSLVYKQL